MRDFDKNPYSPDEARVAKYLDDLAGMGGGDDPIGFILASHSMAMFERKIIATAAKGLLKTLNEELGYVSDPLSTAPIDRMAMTLEAILSDCNLHEGE